MFPLLPNMRVLVLENDDANRALLTYILEDQGATVTAVRTVDSSIQTLHSQAFDLAVVDYKIETGTANHVIHALEIKQIPFVVTSGLTADAALVLADYTFLLKPYSIHELIDSIRIAMERTADQAIDRAQAQAAA